MGAVQAVKKVEISMKIFENDLNTPWVYALGFDKDLAEQGIAKMSMIPLFKGWKYGVFNNPIFYGCLAMTAFYILMAYGIIPEAWMTVIFKRAILQQRAVELLAKKKKKKAAKKAK